MTVTQTRGVSPRARRASLLGAFIAVLLSLSLVAGRADAFVPPAPVVAAGELLDGSALAGTVTLGAGVGGALGTAGVVLGGASVVGLVGIAAYETRGTWVPWMKGLFGSSANTDGQAVPAGVPTLCVAGSNYSGTTVAKCGPVVVGDAGVGQMGIGYNPGQGYNVIAWSAAKSKGSGLGCGAGFGNYANSISLVVDGNTYTMGPSTIAAQAYWTCNGVPAGSYSGVSTDYEWFGSNPNATAAGAAAATVNGNVCLETYYTSGETGCNQPDVVMSTFSATNSQGSKAVAWTTVEVTCTNGSSTQTVVQSDQIATGGTRVPSCSSNLGSAWYPSKVNIWVGDVANARNTLIGTETFPAPSGQTQPVPGPAGNTVLGYNPATKAATTTKSEPVYDPNPAPAPAPAPEPMPDPSSSGNCISGAVSWNPVDWIQVPVQCAIKWAFAPPSPPPAFSDLPSPLPAGWVPSFPTSGDGGCGQVTLPSFSLGPILPATGSHVLFNSCVAPWPLVHDMTYYGTLAIALIGLVQRSFRAVMEALGIAVDNVNRFE